MTTTVPRPTTAEDPGADAVAERVFAAFTGGLEALSVYTGDRLGWYRSLHEDGPATPAALARRTGTHERYAREWLEQQAVLGLLHASGDGSAGRRYTLPAGAGEALTDADSLAYLAPLPRMLAAVGAKLPELLDAYRHGGGVSWDDLGPDARESQADLNRPWFLRALAGALAGVGDVDAVLRRPGARVLDVGCGAGWSTVALANAYPDAQLVGVDVDAPSVEMARQNAAAAGVGDRVRFRLADGGPSAARTAVTTPRSRSSASTTCRGRCRSSPRCGRPSGPTGSSWSWTRRSRRSSRRPVTTSSGSCTPSACSSACRTACPPPRRSAPGR